MNVLIKKEGTAWGSNKLLNILIGWGRRWNIIKTPPNVEEIAKVRFKICEFNEGICAKNVPLLSLIADDIQPVDTLVCTHCSCPCKPKGLVLSEKCPLNKWPKYA